MADDVIGQDAMDSEEKYEIVELEYTEDQIEYYIEDEEGTELGFAIKDEDGTTVEYYYEDNADEYEEAVADNDAAAPANSATQKDSPRAKGNANEDSLAYMAGSAAVKLRSKAEKAPEKISAAAKKAAPAVKKNELKEAASDLNDIYKTGKEVGGELKAAYDDLTGMFDFLPKTPKSKLRKFGRR